MQIELAYGKNGLTIDLDNQWDVTVLEPDNVPGVKNPWQAIKQALRHPLQALPLKELVSKDKTVGIIFNDITRATPNHIILPAILDEIVHVPKDNITFFNALGTHRENTTQELKSMIPREIVENYRIIQNDCSDKQSQLRIGKTAAGNEIYINKSLMACDVKILTGFIEPHFFAGFSGGGKAIMPGMARLDTILRNHGASMVDDPNSVWGEIKKNPIQREIREAAKKAGADFILNVTMNNDHEITAVFAGDLKAAHDAGCDFARQSAMKSVDEPFDIVLTTNSGYPLDQNLYQSVKGMSAAAKVVKQGGAIIIASECSDGIPDHGLYKQLLLNANSPDEILTTVRKPDFLKQDQWQVHIQALIQKKADVYVYSDYLSPVLLKSLLLKPCSDIRETISGLQDKNKHSSKICVLPQGPLTIPFIRKKIEMLNQLKIFSLKNLSII